MDDDCLETNADMCLRHYNDRVRFWGDYKSGISFTRMGLQPHAIQRFGTDMFDVLYNLVLPLIHRNLAG